jgi:uncharacterized protein (DUF302 family)
MTEIGTHLYKSSYEFDATLARLDAELTKRKMTVFSRIDHAAGAAEVGLTLRPTIVLSFGNPMAGTRLMQQAQSIGIDLPLKALVWRDGNNVVWLSLTDPLWLARRYGIGEDENVRSMTTALASIANGTCL